MKNIHVLPTDQPSNLYFHKLNNRLGFSTPEPMGYDGSGSWAEGRSIYITSDEEIKEGDWVYHSNKKIIFKINSNKAYIGTQNITLVFAQKYETCKKIILTTDQDLIKDGVQAIDDEFLEWFVKNPSCEKIEFEKEHDDTVPYLKMRHSKPYKIIIPNQEQSVDEYEQQGLEKYSYQLESEQETLEEVAERFYPPKTTDLICSPKLVRDAYIAGAQWQQENSNINALYFEIDALKRKIKSLKHQQEQYKNKFSEEYIIEILMEYDYLLVNEGKLNSVGNIKKWFEQFKNK